MTWKDETFEDKIRFGLKTSEVLYEGQSPFQKVEIFDTPAYGRTLLLDGIYQTSEKDEYLYHEMLVHPAIIAANSPKRVLIIGGGDGGTAREVLKHDDVEEVVMVEIDDMVVQACKEHIPAIGAGVWDHPKYKLIIGDGVAYVQREDVGQFDVIILDGSDPVGPAEGLFGEDFYKGCKNLLAPGGVFALQSESPLLFEKVFFQIQTYLSRHFNIVKPYFGCVPIYCAAPWSWTFCSQDVPPTTGLNEARAAKIEEDAKYYTQEVHVAAFAQPNWIKKRLSAG